MTLGQDEIAAGRAKLWPLTPVVIHPASMVDPPLYRYAVEGDEHWGQTGGDHNGYAEADTKEIGERIVAAWNSWEGVPTPAITPIALALADWYVAHLIHLARPVRLGEPDPEGEANEGAYLRATERLATLMEGVATRTAPQ